MSVRIFALRHGQTPTNDEGRIQGIADDPYRNGLTGVGRFQAFWAFAALKKLDVSVDAVISSPLRRAYQTAESVALYFGGIPHVVCDALIERDFGTLEGVLLPEAQEKMIAASGSDEIHLVDLATFGGEPTESLAKRADRVNGFLRAEYDGKTVVVVSHGGFLRFWMLHCGMTPPEYWLNGEFCEFTI